MYRGRIHVHVVAGNIWRVVLANQRCVTVIVPFIGINDYYRGNCLGEMSYSKPGRKCPGEVFGGKISSEKLSGGNVLLETQGKVSGVEISGGGELSRGKLSIPYAHHDSYP